MSQPRQNLTGRVYGKLTVLGRIPTELRGGSKFVCLCDCGNRVIVSGRSLQAGNATSCDRAVGRKRANLKNRRFGALVAVSVVEDYKPREIHWMCECDCGGSKIAPASSLTSGSVKSCGCLQKKAGEGVGKSRKIPSPDPGTVFGRLTVQYEYTDHQNLRKRPVACLCSCGRLVDISFYQLLHGLCKSCGCLNTDSLVARSTSHGKSHTAEYTSWQGMRFRCHSETSEDFHHYGGRGIKVCERWGSFQAFYDDMGPRPGRGYSIDRIDVNGDYSPENCRWATQKEQMNNTRDNHLVTHNGQTLTIAEWAELTGVTPSTIRQRLKRGVSVEEALFTPAGRISK